MIPTILTAAGNYFHFEEPEESVFDINEIAHALSHICRFTGHVREFYSVAQHSVLVSHAVPSEDALAGLLHDAPEAYLGDVSSPLKALLKDYQEIEKRVEAAVLTRFGLSPNLPESVKRADLVLLLTEKRDLMPNDGVDWSPFGSTIEPLERRIHPWVPELAKEVFLRRFRELTTNDIL